MAATAANTTDFDPMETLLAKAILENITTITADELYPFILQKGEVDASTIPIVHLLIGSYMCKADALNTSLQRKHELPLIVRRLFIDPFFQFSPEYFTLVTQQAMKDGQHPERLRDITVNQTLFLIDPMYKEQPIPRQFINEMQIILADFIRNRPEIGVSYSEGSLTLTQIVDLAEIGSKIRVTTCIDVYVVPEMIPYDSPIIPQCIDAAKEFFDNKRNLLMTVMSFAGNVTNSLFVNNTQANVFVSKPDCFTIDSKAMNVPVISHKDRVLRWLNLTDDIESLPKYLELREKSVQGFNSREFLVDMMCYRLLNVDLVGLLRLWQFTAITLPIDCPDVPAGLRYSALSYEEFKVYFKKPAFIDLVKSRVGSFHIDEVFYVIRKLNTFVGDGLQEVPNDILLSDVIQKAVVTILRGMRRQFPHLVDFAFCNEDVSRVFLFEFLQMNGLIL